MFVFYPIANARHGLHACGLCLEDVSQAGVGVLVCMALALSLVFVLFKTVYSLTIGPLLR